MLGPQRSPVLWSTTSAPTSRSWRYWVIHTLHTHTHTHTRALISEYMYIMWMCADKQCVLSSPASELQRAVSLLGTEQDSSQLQQTLWVMGARLGSAWPVHYSESLSTSAGGEKVKLSCQALWWIHYDAFFSAAFFFFSFCLAFISLLSQNQRIFVFGHQATETAAWQPAREGNRQTDEGVQRTSYWPRSGTGLNWRKFFPKTKFQSSSEPEKNVPQGSNEGICIVL